MIGHPPTANDTAQDIVPILPPNPPPKPPHAKPAAHLVATTIAAIVLHLCLLHQHLVIHFLSVWMRRERLAKADKQLLQRIWIAPWQIVAMEALGQSEGWRRQMGRGSMLGLNVKDRERRGCVKYFVSIFAFLVRSTVITGTSYFAHQYSL